MEFVNSFFESRGSNWNYASLKNFNKISTPVQHHLQKVSARWTLNRLHSSCSFILLALGWSIRFTVMQIEADVAWLSLTRSVWGTKLVFFFFFDFEHVGVYDVRCYGCDFVELGVGGILTYGVLGAFSLLFGLCLVKVGWVENWHSEVAVRGIILIISGFEILLKNFWPPLFGPSYTWSAAFDCEHDSMGIRCFNFVGRVSSTLIWLWTALVTGIYNVGCRCSFVSSGRLCSYTIAHRRDHHFSWFHWGQHMACSDTFVFDKWGMHLWFSRLTY